MEPDSPPFRPPDPNDDSTIIMRPGQRSLEANLAFQRERAVALSIAAGATVLGRLAGVMSFDYPRAFAVLGVGYLSVLLFWNMARRAWRFNQLSDLRPAAIACDVVLISAMVHLTGGSSSPMFIWYAASAGSAAMIRGLRCAVGVAVFSALAYFAVLLAFWHIWSDAPEQVFRAAAKMVFLFGASALLWVSAAKLRESRALIRRLKEESSRKVDELQRVTQELEGMSELLRDLTLTDALTGLRNRRYLRDRVAAERARFIHSRGVERRAQHAGSRAAGVLLVDLDHFKAINDTHGHPVGDQVLRHIARLLPQCVRAEDSVVRWGGEEFLILLTDAEPSRVADVAERVVATIRSQPYRVTDQRWLMLTASVGWAVFDWLAEQRGETAWDEAVTAADAALYTAKREGRNCSRGLLPNALVSGPVMLPATAALF